MGIKFERLLSDHGISFKNRRQWIQFNCPFCFDENFHGAVNEDSGVALCFKCGHLNLKKTVAKLIRKDESLIGKLLWKYSSGKKPIEDIPSFRDIDVSLPVGSVDMRPRHYEYLRARGFDPVAMERKWSLLGTRENSNLPNRIIIPIYFKNELVSWTTRDISGKCEAKYISCSSENERVPHKNMLYGWDFTWDKVLVVEGPLDVWRIGYGAVATFGISWTTQQVKLLSEKKEVYIAYDGEPRAVRRARRLAEQLGLLRTAAKVVLLDDGLDPADLDNVEIRKLRRLIEG